jgi:hypothetical protein
MRSFAILRLVRKKAEGFELRESQSPYKAFFDTEKIDIEGKNLWFWNEIKRDIGMLAWPDPRPTMIIVAVNYILYHWFPLPLPLPRTFSWPWWVSAVIAVLIIYTRIRHPQAVGEFPLW